MQVIQAQTRVLIMGMAKLNIWNYQILHCYQLLRFDHLPSQLFTLLLRKFKWQELKFGLHK